MLNNIRMIFKNSRHYRIEIFTVMFGIFATMLAITFVAMSAFTVKKDIESRKTKSLYTSNFTTSRTQNKGKVDGVYKSKDGKRLFLLWKFDSIQDMPQTANDYKMFLTKSDPYGNLSYLNNKPTGGIYVFGNTGYMGAMLINSAGFEDSVHSLVTRASTELVASKKEDNSTQDKSFMADESFRKYDQFQIFFNPGVNTIEKLDILSEAKLPEPNMIFETLVTRKEEEKSKTKLDKTLDEMRITLNNVEEAKKRVDLAGMQIPEDPAILKGDKITNKDGKLEYLPVYVFMKGYNFDWRNGSIKSGYLEKVVSEELRTLNKDTDVSKYGLLEYNKFFDLKNELSSKFKNKEVIDKNMKFYLKDGTSLDTLKDGDITGTYDDKKKVSEELVTAWVNYVNLKKRYQEKELEDILRIELTLKLLKGYITFNEEALTVYAK